MPEQRAVGMPRQAFAAIRSEDVAWNPFPAFPPSVRLAVLVGDITKAGPYVIRVKVPGDVKLMPHRHPEDRIYTVISGIFYVREESRLKPTRWKPTRREA